jgi:hypothetical protein
MTMKTNPNKTGPTPGFPSCLFVSFVVNAFN